MALIAIRAQFQRRLQVEPAPGTARTVILRVVSTAQLVLLCTATLGGCAMARMYPVRGPLAEQTPVPVYKAKMTQGPMIPHGSFSAVLGDGEVCKGEWKLGHSPSTQDLAADWDTVYGTGYYSFKVLSASSFMRAEAKGTRGTILNVEMYYNDPNAQAPISPHDLTVVREMAGIAVDNKGNLYKLVFR
jgi:hypothetical protein